MKSEMINSECPACGDLKLHSPYCEKNGWPVYVCGGCGLGRIFDFDFSPAALYDEGYFEGARSDGYQNYRGSEAILAVEFQSTLAHLRRYQQSGRLLEIGCAYGFFLDQARQYFDVFGCDVSEAAAEFCRSRNLQVRSGGLTPTFAAEIRSIDALVMLDVIEHISEPLETLRLAASIMRPGAIGVITTGDFSSLSARLFKSRWRLLTPPLHIWYFTKDSLVKMLAALDCSVVSIEYPWKRVPLDLVLHQALAVLGVRSPSLPSWLGGLGIPANAFDAMRVTFRRDR